MAWRDTFAIMDFAETHGHMPGPGELTLAVLAAARMASEGARADWPKPYTLPVWIEDLANEHAAELELVESRMNPRSREAVRRRRRSREVE